MSQVTNNTFPSHFHDFIVALNKNEVEYLLIGGYAMGAYGHIRGTKDLDIYINATDENAERAIQACIDFGIPGDSVSKEMFLVPKMIGIGEPPLRIEILKKLDVVDFKYAYQRCKISNIEGLEIKIMSIDDLIISKKAALKGRTQSRDKEDLDYLEKIKKLR